MSHTSRHLENYLEEVITLSKYDIDDILVPLLEEFAAASIFSPDIVITRWFSEVGEDFRYEKLVRKS